MSRCLLVTGGTGFIGSHLAESALIRGDDVRVLGLTELESDCRNADYLQSLGAKIFAGDVTDTGLCKSAMEGVTDVFHLAVAMREGGMSDEEFTRTNLGGTRGLLDIALKLEISRFVYCSTIGIFGHRVAGTSNESSPLNPGNIYERTKVAAETLALSYFKDHDLPVVVFTAGRRLRAARSEAVETVQRN